MSFIDQVVAESCFGWNLIGFGYERPYQIGQFTLSNEDDDEVCLETPNYVIARLDNDCVPAPVVAQVIDLLIKNYREV